jgi:hypothetical protein
MPNFAILRLAKLRTLAQVSAAARHNGRRGKVPNACATLRHLNRELVHLPPAGLVQGVRERLPAKVRRNAVLAVEAVFATSAPVADADGWARASLAWAQDRWGAGNIVSATLHRDEPQAGPHLHLVFVPVVAGRLSGKKVFGNRADLRGMQDSYWQAVSAFGLARGRSLPGLGHLTARHLREANTRATEREKALAVAQVAILQARLDAMERQTAKLFQAQARASSFRPMAPPPALVAPPAPVPRVFPRQDIAPPREPRPQERGLAL